MICGRGRTDPVAPMQINYKVSDRSIDTCCNSRAVTKKARGCAAGVRSGDWRAVKADGEENAAVLERLRVSMWS